MLDLIKANKEVKNVLDILSQTQEFCTFMDTRSRDDFEYMDQIDLDNFQFFYGETKGVVVVDYLDYVIKFPFNNHEGDYCNREFNIYCEAKMRGIEHLFAECARMDDYYDLPVYIMAYCDVNADETCYTVEDYFLGNLDEEEADHLRDTGAVNGYSSETVEEFLSNIWDNDDYSAFEQFCEEFNVNDIHAGNIGHLNNKWVVIDYSGYEVF